MKSVEINVNSNVCERELIHFILSEMIFKTVCEFAQQWLLNHLKGSNIITNHN